jgi:hypothetical protein
MKKLLYIAPHLSTGGLPQYLTKKIELLKNTYEIYLVEWVDCTGGVLVVTKNKIVNLVDSDKFFTLGENKQELIDIINKVQPDIVHLEEIPEFFMSGEISKQIYTQDRKYIIVETSHDSSFDTSTKQFFPDKFMFVSNWQIQQYKDIDIPQVVVYYPIEYVDRPNRTEALLNLGLDPNKKHVLHVGLYTSRKNQAEFFEYARQFPDVEFHSLGNRADNFKWYWEPLVQNQPPNLTWWNERTDVDKFYQAMDLFLFTSRGTNNDKETMPLVIREAVSYQIPVLIYNLPVYLNYWNDFEGVSYLEFDNFEKNCEIIASKLGVKINKPEKEAIIISTYPVTDSIINTTKECIIKAKQTGRKIILVSHAPIPEELQSISDYCIFDKNNILTKHTFFNSSWYYSEDFDNYINLKGEDNDVYHGPTVYTNYYNGCILAKTLGIKKVFFLNFDYIINDGTYLNEISSILDNQDAFYELRHEQEGPCVTTFFAAAKPEFYLENFPVINTAEEYSALQYQWGSETNSLENLMYNGVKTLSNIHFENFEVFRNKLNKYFTHKDFSRVEYFTVLPVQDYPELFCPYIQISNSKDSRLLKLRVTKNKETILNKVIEVTNKTYEYVTIDCSNFTEQDVFVVTLENYDLISSKYFDTKTITIDYNYYKNTLPENGWIKLKNYKPKIKLMHLVTEPEINPKEIRSVENVKDFCEKTGIVYEQRINKIWTESPPKDTCNRPDDVQDKPGYYKLAPGHYGCYLAHKNALLAQDNPQYDYILIFEGDVIIDSDYAELYESLKRFTRLSKQTDMDIIGFGNPWQNRNLNGPKVEDIYTDTTPFIPAQSYLINQDKIEKIVDLINSTPWDAFDMWVCNVAKLRVGIAEKIYTKHLPGFSIIEQEFKGMDENSPEIYAAE